MKAASKHVKIISAATKVFAKKGFFNARISDIAKEAKVADGTIYLYFNNKVDILRSVFEEEIDSIIQHTRKLIDEEQDPSKKLEKFVVTHLAYMKKNRYLAEVIHIELRQSTKLIKDYKNSKFNEYLDIIAEIIMLGQQQKVFRKNILPNIAKRVIFGALDEVSRVWNISLETHYSVEEAGCQIVKIFILGMLNTREASDLP